MGHHSKKDFNPKQSTKEKLNSIRKAKKQKQKEKRARLVIRNLPFQTTEENLKEHFEKFGEIEDIKILKKEDNKLVGCAFIQYKLVQKAKKAKHHADGKPFLGRDILVDFALAKDKYLEVKVKQDNECKIKEEPIDPDDVVDVKDETENRTTDEDNIEKDEAEEEKDKDSEVEDDEEENESEEEDQDDDDDDDVEDVDETLEQNTEKKPRFESHDVNEGKTIFIKNVPFSASNEDLKECMRQFGPVYYALICVDKFTEHSKGTAFVKFREREDAEKALAAGTELTLLGNVLDCHKALSRNDIQQKFTAKKEEKAAPKDSRNLYLIKEGLILAGTKAAEGVSVSDMTKRLQLEQFKTSKLKDLNMFISRERLVIHNVPPSWENKHLKDLFKKYSPKSAIIREALIMRDLKNVDANGVGQSKCFGFVTFTRHEDALHALRTLNNNPNIFTAHRRPIVAFSIESRTAINAKKKRLEKSKLKNPKCKDYDPNVVKNDEEKKKRLLEANAEEEGTFVGITAKPGTVQKMRNRFKLKTQAKLHFENVKKEKKKQKFAKRNLKGKQNSIKQPKHKINRKEKADGLSKLVTKYRKQLSAPQKKRTKWFEDK